MSGRLNNKVVLITGASQGIGEAMAKLFCEEGAYVIVNHLDKLNRPKWVDLFAEKVFFYKADVTDENQIREMVKEAIKQFGTIDILINNAGANFFSEPLQLSSKKWKKCFEVDLDAAWYCSKAVLPSMLEKKSGTIINIVSVHGHKIIPDSFPYPVAKHGLIGLTKALALQYASHGIRVNSISPGLILTPSTINYFNEFDDSELAKKQHEQMIPCRRIGEPIEVAYTALFLASDEARFINAADIVIDGGRSQLYHE